MILRYKCIDGLISIHVPHTRDDDIPLVKIIGFGVFQSTSLTRGTTPVTLRQTRGRSYFNPRPSHEGRQLAAATEVSKKLFQSTSLTRGTTKKTYTCKSCKEFQSTSLTRGTTVVNGKAGSARCISIHVPHTRDDLAENTTA